MGRAIKALTSPNELGSWSPKQEVVALALASGESLRDAAKKTGVGMSTAKTWLTNGAFAGRVQELRAEMTARALGRLVDGMVSAADTLGYLSRKGKSEMVRLSASRSVIELGVKLKDSVELEQRIAVLEANQKTGLRSAG